jgi:hypothetical protein
MRLALSVPVRFRRVDLVVAEVGALVVAHLVEHEVLELRPEIRGNPDPRASEIGFRLLRNITGVPAVALPRHGVADIADQHQGRCLGEGVRKRGCRVGDHQHVAFLNFLESADRRAVEADAFDKTLEVESHAGTERDRNPAAVRDG